MGSVESTKNFRIILVTIFWNFTLLISGITYFLHVLPHELQNHLGLKDLKIFVNIRSQIWDKRYPSSQPALQKLTFGADLTHRK